MRSIFAMILAVALLGGSVVRAQEVIVGTNAEFPPFEFTDDDNNIVGYDPDIVTAIGKAAGFEVKMSHMTFDTLIEALNTDKIDAVASGMTITDARREKVDFSDPYYDAAQVIVVKADGKGYETMEEIKDKVVGVQLGTTGALLAAETMGEDNLNLKQYQRYNDVFSDLKLERIDAVVVDKPVAQAYLKKIDGLRISSPPMSEETYGIAIKKGNKELLDKVNLGLKKIRESGEFDRISDKWFQD